MSNQNFKMILTGPISAMGDVVNAATGHGGKIEMVEIEDAKQVPQVKVSQMSLLNQIAQTDEAVRLRGRGPAKGGVSAVEVYRVFRDFDLQNSTSVGVWKCLEGKLGRKINKPSVNAAIHRLVQCGFVSVTTPERERYRSYKCNGVGLTDQLFVERYTEAIQEMKNQDA
jgi:hypothetical protein